VKKIFSVIYIILLLFCFHKSYAQIKPDNLDLTLQADATTTLFSTLLSCSGDVDVYNFGTNKIRYYTGFRVGFEQYKRSSIDGNTQGPFRDITFLGKFSISWKILESSCYLGLSHKLSDDNGTIDSKKINNYKIFLELKLKVYKNFVGLVFKPGYVGSGKSGDFIGGLGIFIGASTKDIKF
jgi:hypothetical protein